MDSAEYTRWLAFDLLSPIGGERWDWLFAWLIVHIISMFNSTPQKVASFLPKWDGAGSKRPKTLADSAADVKAWAERIKQRQAKRGASDGK